MGKGNSRFALEVFGTMAPGTPFRYPAGDVPEKWIYCRFDCIDCGYVMFSMWDDRHGGALAWYQSNDVTRRIESWDPSLEHQDLAIPISIRTASGQFEISPWVLGELVGSSWINRHTMTVLEDAIVDWDRFGKLQLYCADEYRLSGYTSLTMWGDLGEPGQRGLLVEHWARYDTMPLTEKIEYARRRVAREAEISRDPARSLSPRRREFEEAKGVLQELTGSVVDLDVLNAGARVGEQLALL